MNAIRSSSRCSGRSSAPEMPASRLAAGWVQELRTQAEVSPVLDEVCEAMAALQFPERDVFAVRLSLEEALVNALKHGNGGDPAKKVAFRYLVVREGMAAEIEDQGRGFDPDQVADPLAEENLERTSGRGLFLMRAYMSWVRYNERGNRVSLGKFASVR